MCAALKFLFLLSLAVFLEILEQPYLAHYKSKLGDFGVHGYHFRLSKTFIKDTFSFKAWFYFIFGMQSHQVYFAQFHQNGYISRFTDHMKVRLVPKFSRLQALQLCRRKFCLEISVASS